MATAPLNETASAPVVPEHDDAAAAVAAYLHQHETKGLLRFITCGSVDDGKSTLIGRLLVDSKAVLQDHLAGVQRQGQTDLALLTDGLSAEREQGITIDVAYRYFSTEARKFIIGDAPGHEQYTRNMVTAASSADAAVVLVDATKLDWRNPQLALLPQTRRHSLLLQLLRVPSVVFAINKLDAVDDSTTAFAHIGAALAHAQYLARTLQHHGVHAKGHCAVQAPMPGRACSAGMTALRLVPGCSCRSMRVSWPTRPSRSCAAPMSITASGAPGALTVPATCTARVCRPVCNCRVGRGWLPSGGTPSACRAAGLR